MVCLIEGCQQEEEAAFGEGNARFRACKACWHPLLLKAGRRPEHASADGVNTPHAASRTTPARRGGGDITLCSEYQEERNLRVALNQNFGSRTQI